MPDSLGLTHESQAQISCRDLTSSRSSARAALAGAACAVQPQSARPQAAPDGAVWGGICVGFGRLPPLLLFEVRRRFSNLQTLSSAPHALTFAPCPWRGRSTFLSISSKSSSTPRSTFLIIFSPLIGAATAAAQPPPPPRAAALATARALLRVVASPDHRQARPRPILTQRRQRGGRRQDGAVQAEVGAGAASGGRAGQGRGSGATGRWRLQALGGGGKRR